MTHLRLIFLTALILPLASAHAFAADKPDDSDFQARTYKNADGKTLLYRLIAKPTQAQEKRPLVVFLHGAGERGSDNTAQLKYLREFLRSAANDCNAVCIAPQCPRESSWANFRRDPNAADAGPREPLALTLELINELQKEFPIDADRIYVTGLSMGGFGTWDILARQPELVAAAVPICGGGNPARAERMTGVPIWVFHGDQDPAVKVEQSRRMVEAIKKAGGDVKYTEYAGVGHDSWIKAYAEPELLKWMMAQKRKAK